ncbi:unnamed protein product, partial [Phaeothamnion confervicola]
EVGPSGDTADPDVFKTDADEKDVEQFQWFKQWYPLRAVDFLDASRPHAVQLLGRELVLWNDGSTWQCYEDACPHRMAPLSEGRIESDGSLLCAYHAWRFAGADGKCVSIPQSDAMVREKHMGSPMACAKSYPVTVAQDMIFVWPESGPDAVAAAAAQPPPLVPEMEDVELVTAGRVRPLTVNIRDLPYSWDMFFENVVDAAHVPVSHHGLVGNRYTGAQPLNFKSLRPVTTK